VAGKVGEHTHHELAFYGQEMEDGRRDVVAAIELVA